MTSRRVLIIAYSFPPVGGAGVQRVVKWAKYLPRFGWAASVLTVSNPSVPAFDERLLDEIPASTIIRRAPTLEPSYAVKALVTPDSASADDSSTKRVRTSIGRTIKAGLRRAAMAVLQPDPQILWAPSAVRAGKRLLRCTPHAAVLATGPPFSSFLVGRRLSRMAGLPLVLDYRDEWDLSHAYLENKRLGPFARCIQSRMQRRVLGDAAAVVATTCASADALRALPRRAGNKLRTTAIYNGFDPEDFPPQEFDFLPQSADPRDEQDRFRLVYVGTLWNLTSVAPLVAALERLAGRHPELARQLELVTVGRRTAAQDALLDRLTPSPVRLTRRDYTEHAEAIAAMRAADMVCLLLADAPGAERVVPAKLFEYLAAGRPLLAIAPRGEVHDLVAGYPHSTAALPDDVEGMVCAIARAMEHRGPRPRCVASSWTATPFSRIRQAGQLAALLDDLIATPARSHAA